MTCINQERLGRIEGLKQGKHRDPEAGMCVMEAVAWITDDYWTDYPACVDSALAATCQSINDIMPDDLTRTKYLLPLVTELVDTAGYLHDDLNFDRWNAKKDECVVYDSDGRANSYDWNLLGPLAQECIREWIAVCKSGVPIKSFVFSAKSRIDKQLEEAQMAMGKPVSISVVGQEIERMKGLVALKE
jgi:hypothetical protein